MAFEPIPETFAWLEKNIAVNGLDHRIEALNMGLGDRAGSLRFSANLDTVNHVLTGTESELTAVEVPIAQLDDVLKDTPIAMKIDVEGFESQVLQGAKATLQNSGLLAVVIELNGSGTRYGVDDSTIHKSLLDYGFNTYQYLPFDRKLVSLQGQRSTGSNALYVRNESRVHQRLATAGSFQLGNGTAI